MLSTLARRAAAEAIGTALLLSAVVGSGIAAQTLSPTDAGLELLESALVTGAALIVIIVVVGSVSGAHLNPVVSCVDALLGGLRRQELAVYVAAQLVGAIAGTILANVMFSLAPLSVATHVRSGGGVWLGEVVATFGLVLVVFGAVRGGRAATTPFVVGAYITAAYVWTSSTSFANPAVTLARMLSDTFAGIAPVSVPVFVAAQVVGAGLGYGVVRLLWPDVPERADQVVVPHPTDQPLTRRGTVRV